MSKYAKRFSIIVLVAVSLEILSISPPTPPKPLIKNFNRAAFLDACKLPSDYQKKPDFTKPMVAYLIYTDNDTTAVVRYDIKGGTQEILDMCWMPRGVMEEFSPATSYGQSKLSEEECKDIKASLEKICDSGYSMIFYKKDKDPTLGLNRLFIFQYDTVKNAKGEESKILNLFIYALCNVNTITRCARFYGYDADKYVNFKWQDLAILKSFSAHGGTAKWVSFEKRCKIDFPWLWMLKRNLQYLDMNSFGVPRFPVLFEARFSNGLCNLRETLQNPVFGKAEILYLSWCYDPQSRINYKASKPEEKAKERKVKK